MKIWELASGINIMLSEEENDLLEGLIKNSKKKLDEREEIVAQTLVSKGVFNKIDENDDVSFLVNYRADVWRD